MVFFCISFVDEGLLGMIGAQGLLVKRNLHHAIPAVTRNLDILALLDGPHTTYLFSRLLRQTRRTREVPYDNSMESKTYTNASLVELCVIQMFYFIFS
jgi:hypothetical protein